MEKGMNNNSGGIRKDGELQNESNAGGDAENFLKGSYTVEAAAVFSILFFVLAALILCTFYVHDRAVLQSSACEIAAAGSSFATAKERQEAVNAAKKRISTNRFLGSRGVKGSTSVGKKEVSASWKATYPIPGMVMKYFSGSSLKLEESWTSRVETPADTIRVIRGAGELLTGGTD